MNNRVLFESHIQRKKFFNLILKKSSLGTWKELYTLVKIPRQVFDLYKSGKLTLSLERYNSLSKFLNKNEINNFSRKIKLVDENWGRIKGGLENYKKHKDILAEGRKKGLLKLLKSRHENYRKFENFEIDKNLSYFIGLLIGDGFTNKYGGYYLIQFVGHKDHELNYYKEIICPYVKETFNLNPIIKESKEGNFFRVNIYSKGLFNLLTKEIGIPKGRKSHIILIPPKILASQKEILLSCIAGIYDAEGCIFFDKRKAYSKPYPRIDLHMLNLPILNQIKKILDDEGIISSVSNILTDNSRILVYGEKNVKNFLKKIHIKNPKHLNKLKEHNLV